MGIMESIAKTQDCRGCVTDFRAIIPGAMCPTGCVSFTDTIALEAIDVRNDASQQHFPLARTANCPLFVSHRPLLSRSNFQPTLTFIASQIESDSKDKVLERNHFTVYCIGQAINVHNRIRDQQYVTGILPINYILHKRGDQINDLYLRFETI
jgi:hypothetical protein